TPRGGTGLNAAVRDGFDLGWKLGWVLRGWADDALLDTFERERRPVAEHNLGRSMREDGSLFSTAAGLQADVGGRIPHVWAAAGRSTLDLLGDGITVFAGPDWDGDVPYGGPPVTVARIDAFRARALGLAEDGALVARPDGRPLALLSSRACAVRGKEVASTG
ncbi:MAG: putative polyketide hydroxylase, partial [Frankiaceae bacterium]|nr:putative polyketide hydroxylase [Frankiaceae bacterium]